MNFKKFVKERDSAIEKAVVDDDWTLVKKYCEKYKVPMPEDEKVFKAGIYKAAQECQNLSEDTKVIAATKCIRLGFHPTLWTAW